MVVGKLISETKSTFIKDRNIMDGVVVLNEVIEDARRNNGKRLVFKVDEDNMF